MCDSCAQLKSRLIDLEVRIAILEGKFPKDIVIIPLSKNVAKKEGSNPPFLLPTNEDLE